MDLLGAVAHGSKFLTGFTGKILGLDTTSVLGVWSFLLRVPLEGGLKGNPVEVRDGPAAVYGDETPRVVPDAIRSGHYSTEWEGRGSRTIR